MRSGDLFIETLKRIGYHEADSLHDSDFNSLISKEELKSFFEVFCTLNEYNVLTAEEIEEYSALTSDELAEIEILKKSGQFEENDIEREKKKEAYFLQEQLMHIESHNKILERQIDCYKKHEEDLLQEKEIEKKFLLNAKKKFKTCEMSSVPKAEEEFVSSLKSTLEIVQDLESLILHSDNDDNKLPTSSSFKDIVQQYLEAERKVLQSINAYMHTNFQLQENGTLSFISNEMLQNKELEKETLFLKKKMKFNMVDNIMSETEAYKIENMVKYLETVSVSNINSPSSQLRQKLDDVGKCNEKLKKKEEEYKAYVCDSISKHVDALVADIALCAANETFNHFQFYTKKMSLPKNYLVRQRLRVEKLIASIYEHTAKFHSIKELIGKVLKQVKEEQSSLQERQLQIDKELSDLAEKQIEQHPETSVFSSLYKILATSEDSKSQDMSKISERDVMQKANKFFEVEENFKSKHNENLKTIDLIENHAYLLESLMCADRKYSDWPELEQSLNANLNNLAMKLTFLEESISECNKDLDQKQKVLEKNRNLQLARHLYVYALVNKEVFKKYIDDIKVATENSTVYKS